MYMTKTIARIAREMSAMAEYTAHLTLPLLLQSPFLHLSSHHIQALSGLLDQQTKKNKKQPQFCQPIQGQGTKSTNALDPSGKKLMASELHSHVLANHL